MSLIRRSLQLMTLCLISLALVQSANILAIYPTASYSHQMPMLSLARALAEKGHNLTVITANPFRTPIPNFTEIDISFTYDYWKSQPSEGSNRKRLINLESQYKSGLQLMTMFIKGANVLTDITLASPPIQKFIKYLDDEKPKFDLVLYENLLQPAFVGFIHKVGHPPLISIVTIPLMCSFDMSQGNPCNPSHMADIIFSAPKRMSFMERVYNYVMFAYSRWVMRPGVFEAHNAIAHKYFGDDLPPLESILTNRSLHLTSSMWMFEQPRPVYPNTIHVGPLHIGTTKRLSEDLTNWIKKSNIGFVYLSFGSNMKSAALDLEKRSAILSAFAKFPEYQFIWKWENETIEGLPSNVLCQKWLPQHDLLAHPDIKLFITQGGLQSLQEGVHYQVPMIGIPFFGDQYYNVRAIPKLEVGFYMEFEEVNTDTLYKYMYEILNNDSYKKSAERASLMSKTQMMSPRDTGVWWVEYVLKLDGNVNHLRPDWWHLSWYEYLGLDILFALIVTILTIMYTSYTIISKLLRYLVLSRHLDKGKPKTQ